MAAVGLPGVVGGQTIEREVEQAAMVQKRREVTFQESKTSTPYEVAPVHVFGQAGNRLETKPHSAATIRFDYGGRLRLRDRSVLELVPREEGLAARLVEGGAYFAGYDGPREAAIETPHGEVRPLGTEFVIEVEEGRTQVLMLDGSALLKNDQGEIKVEAGWAGRMEEGQVPRTARVLAENFVQWWLYYPAVLDVNQLKLTPAERQRLGHSPRDYEEGDLLGAMDAFGGTVEGADVKVFRAQLLLAAGSVAEAQELLSSVDNAHPGRDALERLLAAVTGKMDASFPEAATAGQWLADSYRWQSRHELSRALEAAYRAMELSPDFGWAYARAAELEFSFGRNDPAREALEHALKESPRLAAAHALQGFLWAAQNRMQQAEACFDRAMSLDSGLAQAWLGMGLTRIRRDDLDAGLEYLKTAAVLEPERSLLHSYLAKAFQQASNPVGARKELEYAQRLDAEDPTPWLYSGLVNFQQNKVNDAIADLERSQELNDRRAVYRSRLLLDQDAAVRSANLANLYADAGLEEAGLREAIQGVQADPSSFSSHLFLANSYQSLLDPGRVVLRYESAAATEYLLANLLAPVGAGILSPTISQQEYSKLLQSDGLGWVSDTEYRSRGAWNQAAAFHGTHGNTSFSVDGFYRTDPGHYANQDLEVLTFGARWKQQLTEKDSLYAQILWSESESGDLVPRYRPANPFTNGGVNPLVEVEETQEPIALAGYHRAWSPGSHSLVLAGYLNDRLHVDNPLHGTSLVLKDDSGLPVNVEGYRLDQRYKSEYDLGTLELRQILGHEDRQLTFGLRAQKGRFDFENRHETNSVWPPGLSGFTEFETSHAADMERLSGYGYYRRQLWDQLSLSVGLSYDWLKYPENFRHAPLSDDEEVVDQLSPKAGLTLTPHDRLTVRAAYSRQLTGPSFDQSVRIEPSHVEGINQALRGGLPDAVTGANAGEQIDLVGMIFDYRTPTRTYFGLLGQVLWSEVEREAGVYDVFSAPVQVVPSSTTEELDYREESVQVSMHQLIGHWWSAGAIYRVSHADLEARLSDWPSGITTGAGAPVAVAQEVEAWLHEVRLVGVMNHPSGFFAKGEALWHQQSNQGYAQDLAGDEFWQFNAYVGWRWFERRAEWTVGILNLTDRNYRLNPLNLHAELPRERTFYTRLKLSF